jgi:HPt (histidine-containing phosphotransfer) domain-containing protein
MDTLTDVEPQTFKNLVNDLGADFVCELVETYCKDSRQQLHILRTALDQGDQTTFTRAAHTIKSTSLTFGALGYANLARELETLGRAGELEQAYEKSQQLVDACESLHRRLKDLCYG